jgi:transposase-like protein
MTLEDSIHGLRLRAMQRAQELGNVSAACRELGISRALTRSARSRERALFSFAGLPAGGIVTRDLLRLHPLCAQVAAH